MKSKVETSLQNDVIVSFKTVSNKGNQLTNDSQPKKVKWLSVEVSEHNSDHGEMFSIDLNFREQVTTGSAEVTSDGQ